ncbi:hypothetical protein D3OALGB2SA_3160 [Olavius algarvensis associated proteobacterium Delta 3]|nr:hypothetical protein D3OALGB2SA_3160 [Olavius algarvensis associated proteobacterium Delta 3]
MELFLGYWTPPQLIFYYCKSALRKSQNPTFQQCIKLAISDDYPDPFRFSTPQMVFLALTLLPHCVTESFR